MTDDLALPGHSARLDSVGADILDDGELDALDWTNDETKHLPGEEEVIKPFGWRILVMPMRPRKMIGSIIVPITRQETDQYLNYVGRVVALGPLCFKHNKYAQMGLMPEDVPKRGDWIIYPIYQYARIDFRGTKLILLNDDSFIATVPKGVSPWDFKLER